MSAVDSQPFRAAAGPVEVVLDRCCAEADRQRSGRHPFIARLRDAGTDTTVLRRWAVHKYHQVFLQNVVFSAIHSSAPAHEDVRQYAMDQLIAEETDRESGSASHYDLMRRFAEACGAGDHEFDPAAADPRIWEWVDALLGICRSRHFTLSLLALHSIERQSGEAAGKLLDVLRAETDLSAHDLEWFHVHAEEEDDHAAMARSLILRHAVSYPGFADEALDVTREICAAWTRLHDFYLDVVGEAAAASDGRR